MTIEAELSKYNVSRETMNKISEFVTLLRTWNERMNLVSKKSLEDVWQRHVLDSVQLIEYIPSDIKLLVDIGSGSGFPGIILAILLKEKNPSAQINLVESITKKALYLKDVCDNLGLNNVNIINNRVENVVFKSVDVVTARAVASLDILFSLCAKEYFSDAKLLFPKGSSYKTENEQAQKNWRYNMSVHQNKYHDDGVVLEIINLRKKK